MSINHRIIVDSEGPECRYSTLQRGQLFRHINRQDDTNIYMKVGTRAFTLRGGAECSLDQDHMVMPLKKGTKIRITVGGIDGEE